MAAKTPFVYCFDRNFADIAAVSAYSLSKNHRGDVKIYWIVPRPDVDIVREKIATTKQIRTMDITVIGPPNDIFAGWKTDFHFTVGTYLRLLIQDIVDDARVIYIDADTLVLEDLTELYTMDIRGCPVAGALDPGAGRGSKIPRAEDDPYINAGVMLLDLDALRADRMLEKSMRIYQQYVTEATWLDQCIINKYAENRKFIVDDIWNVRIFANQIRDTDFLHIALNFHPAILHFVGPTKPWHSWCNPIIADYWWHIATELKIETLVKQPIASVDNAISFARCLDMNEKFRHASLYKDKIIDSLLASR